MARFTVDSTCGDHKEFNDAMSAWIYAVDFRDEKRGIVEDKLYGYPAIDPDEVRVATVEVNDTRYTKKDEWEAAVKKALGKQQEEARLAKKGGKK